MKFEDLRGQTFGRLTVVERGFNKNKRVYWKCRCSCGNSEIISVSTANLRNGKVQSCGCLKKETLQFFRNLPKIKSFKIWCLENNRQDYLELWDYELNIKLPSEIGYSSNKQFYFKCPMNKHNSELKKIANLTFRVNYNFKCTKCNSFAQWGINNICEDFLEKYWDYNKNIVNPWEISYATNKRVWIKCQEKDYHDSYEIQCSNFINNKRCPYCNSKKINKFDSLGYLYPEVLKIWSNKNKFSPYEISLHSGRKIWFKCQNGTHGDYKRVGNHVIGCKFECPKCKITKGEQKIIDILTNLNINYYYQKEYEGLIGVRNGLLSYDFYLQDYKILIEYQGNFHDGTVNYQTEEEFQTQQEHDRRKREYAKKNNIELLEIWYWDYDNIEGILKKRIKNK